MKKLGFGLMRLPLKDPQKQTEIDLETLNKMVDQYLASGFTYFDTAAPYHGTFSEVAFRESVAKRYPRDAYTITDKLSLFMTRGEEDFPGFFQAQLERLGVDYVDYYWLHGLGEPGYRQAEETHAFDFLKKLKAEGKAKHIGLSFHDRAAVLDEILTAHPEMEYVQLQINYLDWENPVVESRKCYEVATKHGKPVIVMEPVKGGNLAKVPEAAAALMEAAGPGLSPASWAIRYAASLPNVMVVLSGMSDEAQVADNTGYMRDFQPLTEGEKEMLAKAAEIIHSAITVPCTACRYCVDECPQKIAIPDYFAIYNNLKQFGPGEIIMALNYYASVSAHQGKASDCLECGACEARCPQHLPIREYLKDVAKTLEPKF